ncbi:hypothetical protein [Tenacibaculum sp.]|uniref:hypothetical protein n=1 Tax=Tenacibaculum sp. TaxID=1906242 RepID=UPI003D0F3A6E
MKKNILYIIFIVLVFVSSTISAQVTQRIMPGDEFLEDNPIVIGDLQPKAECTEFNCAGYENISFRKYDIEHTLRMENLIHSIQSKGISDWLFIQEKIVKTELDRITYTNTTSKYGDYYKIARDIYFERLERGITTNNVNYYNRSYGNSINSKKAEGTTIMKDLKGLTLRHQEIKNGNLYNSKYGLYKYNGQPLSNYKSLSDVASLLKNELSNYYSNDVAMNDNQRIKNRLNQMIKDMSPSSVSSDIMLNKKNFFVDLLRSKESHFKSFSTWNELNLMQKYINKVYKGSNSGTVWPKDFGTKEYVLNHAKANKLGELTVFHPDYWKKIYKEYMDKIPLFIRVGSFSYTQYVITNTNKAKAEHKKLKENEINKIMALTPINDNLAVDFIVEDLTISNLNELEWLNNISEEEADRIKGVLQMAKASWGSDLDLGSIYRQKKEIEIERIKNAGLVVQMVKDLGITNTTQKSWLYNNIPDATQVRLFLDANKINGIVNAEVKAFALEAIKTKSIKYINENFDLTQKSPFKVDMTQVLDSIQLPTVTPDNKIAAEKFKCIYDKVIKSPKFKDLFINLFDVNKDINVKFEIADDFVTKPDRTQTNGNCKLENYSLNTDGSIKTANVLIKINKNKLTATSFELSNVLMAKTIIHESIHAYLSVKRKDCNAGTTIDYLNNLEFKELIEEYYDGTCATKQEQHGFMFDYMVPTLSQIFTEVRDDLIPQSNINYVESASFDILGNSTNWSWQDFYYYSSLEGLHETESFKSEIKNNELKNALYEHYRRDARGFSKTCN